jgi:hypothetical protein
VEHGAHFLILYYPAARVSTPADPTTGAALQLTLPPTSPAVHDAVLRAALSSSETTLVLAAPASAVRLAMLRVA